MFTSGTRRVEFDGATGIVRLYHGDIMVRRAHRDEVCCYQTRYARRTFALQLSPRVPWVPVAVAWRRQQRRTCLHGALAFKASSMMETYIVAAAFLDWMGERLQPAQAQRLRDTELCNLHIATKACASFVV